jgi:hypothetical protein
MLRTLVPATVVIEEEPVSTARKRLLELSTHMEQEVADARKLPGS